MTIEKKIKSIRAEQRQRFGNVGLKPECENFYYLAGKSTCRTCIPVYTTYGKRLGLQCEHGVCYFYKSKENKNG